MDLLMIAFVLGSFILLVFGVLGLIRPSLSGMKNRKRSSFVYFGGMVVFFIIAGLFASETSGSNESIQIGSKEAEIEVKTESSKTYFPLVEIIDQYTGMTKLQQDNWEKENIWKYDVEGKGTVSEVKKTDWMSEISDAEFEVICELADGYTAILFYGKDNEEEIAKLKR